VLAEANSESQKDKSLLSPKKKPHFKTRKSYWDEQKYGHGSRRGAKSRMSVLVKTSSKRRSRQL
jgi:hypothetical protein